MIVHGELSGVFKAEQMDIFDGHDRAPPPLRPQCMPCPGEAIRAGACAEFKAAMADVLACAEVLACADVLSCACIAGKYAGHANNTVPNRSVRRQLLVNTLGHAKNTVPNISVCSHLLVNTMGMLGTPFLI